ncbi:uncharacterized protein si:ch211-14c7.2 [Triplophysa dalaica]|uniref:uncharacterized protein si:ch211-14c7.2 n=1 Tax=Triplophysa dalaica TaxID=1582913 RepID=UPI0024DF470B|nr:uncharacterized protein si:ch211-14c7.2 [Triplophysa dalaica]
MLQRNNNNNHPCLDMTHRELMHDCIRPSVSFTSALEFGAIPLIKGLRAWAVSGGYSKARRKAVAGPRGQGMCQQPPENRVGQRGWAGQVSSSYGQMPESTSSTTRTPGVRQGGLGALVTVATLKGTEGGGRQTQTRCLFLKAQGRGNYICAVENRGGGMRIAGARTDAVILEGEKEKVRSIGPRLFQDGTDGSGTLKAKPRAIRKWRKCSKSTGTAEKKTSKGKITNPPREPERDDKNNTVISEESINTSPDRIKQCQKEEDTSQEDTTELKNDKRAHSPISMHIVAPESTDTQTYCSSAKPCANTGEQIEDGMASSPSDNCLENCERSSCANDEPQGDIEISKCDHHLNANDIPNIEKSNKDRNPCAVVPNVPFVLCETTLDTFEIKPTTPNCNTEPSVGHPPMKASSEDPVNNIHENQDQESRTDECSLNCENQHSVENLTNPSQRGGPPDASFTVKPAGCMGHRCIPARAASNTNEKNWKPPMCSPQQREELVSERKILEVQQSNKSSSRGYGSSTADETVISVQSQSNPAPPTTAAIATAIPAEGGARGEDLLPLENFRDLPSELTRDGDNVATSHELGDGDEDEFGAFMQAGGTQLWTTGFTELQQSASGDDYNSGDLKSCTDANESTSWHSDWTVIHPFQQSESSWVAFSQESVEQKAPDGQWWLSTVDKPNLLLSPIHDVSSVFQKAFPSEKPSHEDPDDIPTLTQLLQGPDGNGNTGDNREKTLLDGLQDLDRMIGLNCKRAESLSCKLLLQSLHLQRPSSDCVTVRVKGSARFSPNLPTSNQQLATSAKRRLSYDFNRNIMT